MKEMNLMSGISNELSKYEFWCLYLRLLNSRKNLLDDNEIRFIAYCLTKPNVHEAIKDSDSLVKVTKMSKPTYYNVKKRLPKKKVLYIEEDEYYLNSKFNVFKNFIEKTKINEIKFSFPVKIKDEKD